MKHCIFILFYCSCNLLATYAQTVTWSIPPTYPTLEEYGDVYKVREHGKVGLVSRSGTALEKASLASPIVANPLASKPERDIY